MVFLHVGISDGVDATILSEFYLSTKSNNYQCINNYNRCMWFSW